MVLRSSLVRFGSTHSWFTVISLEGCTKIRPSLEKATPWRWQGWEDFGGLRLSREKVQEEGGTRIHFPVLAVLERVDDRVFESPETALPGEP